MCTDAPPVIIHRLLSLQYALTLCYVCGSSHFEPDSMHLVCTCDVAAETTLAQLVGALWLAEQFAVPPAQGSGANVGGRWPNCSHL